MYYLGAVSFQEAKADIFLNFCYNVYLGNAAAAKKMLRTVISAHLSNNRRHAPSNWVFLRKESRKDRKLKF